MDCSMLGFPVLHQHPEVAQTHIHSVSDAIQSSHRLSSPFPPPFNFPNIRVISNEPVLHIRWGNYWSFNISLSSKYSGLISFRIDWLDLLAVQSTLKSLLHTTIQKHQFFSSQPIFYVLLRWLILFLYLSILLYTIFNSVSRFKSWNYSVYVCAPMYFTFYLLRKFSFWYLSYFLVSFYTKQSKKIF